MSAQGWLGDFIDALMARKLSSMMGRREYQGRVVPAVPGGAGWFVLADFVIPETTTLAIEASGCVSQSGLTCSVRLFDVTSGGALSEVAFLDATSTESDASLPQSLTGAHRYQLQAQCTGASDPSNFAAVQTVALTEG